MTLSTQTTDEWARSEFGHAALGDPRRTARLVSLATRAANDPDGKLTTVCAGAPAELEGAYRFLRSGHVRTEAISEAAHVATAQRCGKAPFVYCPVDGSSLHIVDRQNIRGLGVIGARQKKARGVKVISGIAVLPDGTPMGLAGQRFWMRSPRRRRSQAQKRPLRDKESKYWLEVMDGMKHAFADAAVSTKLWYQLDREGDFWQLLCHAPATQQWFTVRSKADRRVVGGQTLRSVLAAAPIAGCFQLVVPAARHRQERVAWMELRFATVTLEMKDAWSSKRHHVTVTVVNAVELGTTPPGEKPLEWRLLTNWPVATAQDAWQVVFGYSQRWRVEDFHKTWKSGACHAEDTQLGSASAIIRWCTILASVAMRIERLKYLARTEPRSPASVELSRIEIDALIVLRKPAGVKRGDDPDIGSAVTWIAELGGYTGGSSGGPPGSIVIGRGLEKLQTAVLVLENLGEKL